MRQQAVDLVQALVLRNMSDALSHRLKGGHRYAMDQGATVALEAGGPGEHWPRHSPVSGSRCWLLQEIGGLPLLDPRQADENLGTGDDGLCR